MPWYFPWSDSIKKRACRYLLQHYLGHFLKEKLTLDQLSVDLYNGTGTIQEVLLDVMSLNEALDNLNVPIEIVDGFIGSISVTIPWAALMTDNTIVEIQNLEITLQPKQRAEHTGVMLDSMFNSMTTSMQLAQECLKQVPTEGEQQAESAQPFEGLEMFAQTIEAVLSRIKVSFKDTIIRLEHLPKESSMGAALECRIARIEYFDDLAADIGSSVDSPSTDSSSKNVFEPAAIAHKNLRLMGVQLFCDEFPASHRTFSRTFSAEHAGSDSQGSSMPSSPPLFKFEPPLTTGPQGSESSSTLGKESEPIQIAVFTGKQELKLKIKQREELPGPKLELDSQFGSVNMHLSPKQIHLLLEIANGLATPGLCDDSNVRPAKGRTFSDPESEKSTVKSQYPSVPQQGHGWGGVGNLRPNWQEADAHLPLDDSDDEVYFDMARGQSDNVGMDSSFSSISSKSTVGSYYNYVVGYSKSRERESPFQATIPKNLRNSKAKQQKQKDTLHKLMDDPTAEVTKYKMKISFLSAMILHEDPPKTPSDGIDPEQTSWEKLRDMSHKYFGRAQGISTSGMNTDLSQLREEFSKICPHDHLSLLGKPITVECTMKSSTMIHSLHTDLTVGVAELVEAVFDKHRATHSLMGFHLPIENILPEYCELLTFIQDVSMTKSMYSSLTTTTTPCVKLKISSVEKLQNSRRHSPPKTEIHIELGKCRSEVDMTLVDRIQALLKPQPLTQQPPQGSVYMSAYRSVHPSNVQSRQALFSQTMDEGTTSEHRVDLKVSASSLTCSVRFPIPDLRSGQGVQKPWWRRCLRRERLILELTDAGFSTTLNGPEQSVSKFEIICREGHGLFQLDPHLPPMSFLRISSADTGTLQEREEGFDWPRLVVSSFPARQSVLEEADDNSDDSTPYDSLNGACQFPKSDSSPFSQKKTMYDNEEMVMPGDHAEMSEFQEKASNNTKLSLDFTIPNANILLPSKDFFEIIYNRLINDMALWEPSAPAPLDTQEPYSMLSGQGWSPQLVTHLTQDMHLDSMQASSALNEDSDSDSEESSGHCFQSMYEHRKKRKHTQAKQYLQSKMTINLNITKGKLTACEPLLDEEGKKSCEKQGEFQVEVDNLALFSVVHYNGDPELQFLCVQAHRAALYHNGCVDIPSEWSVVGRASMGVPSHLNPTIYLSDKGVLTKLTGQVGLGDNTLDMLSVALKIKVDSFRNVKEYQAAVGVRGGTLHYRMCPTGQSWFDQVTGFFNVEDYPVLGYTMPKIVTELHCHLWSCALDYRPLFLKYRAMLTVEAFSICSNIVAESQTSLLRFRVDDAALYLSDQCKTDVVDLKKNYVCVIDMGLFELSLRISDGRNPKYPKMDLKLSTNILHLRTCSDSCRALCEIITYFAKDQDLEPGLEKPKEYEERQESEVPVASVSSLSSSPQLSQSHMEQVHDMMADAMRESTSSSEGSESNGEGPKPPTKVFFFPDESRPQGESQRPARAASPVGSDISADSRSISSLDQASLGTSQPPSPPPHVQVLGQDSAQMALDHFSDSVEHYNDDEEFCIINEPGLGISPRGGEPSVRVLATAPIQIQDNHFQLPLGKTDLLKAPDHFPVPVYRYTLGEMSLVWYIYGGRDFQSSSPSKFKPSPPHPTAKQRKSSRPGGMGKIGWQARGGLRRDIDVLMELQLNKVRVQYEIYPEHTTQASRQIILINEVEIRDRLLSSNINKFLYQYTSNNMPRQTHANMLLVKVLNVRPEPSLPAQEGSLKVSLQPLRLNIDQDSLFFLRAFFVEIAGEEVSSSPSHKSPAAGSGPSSGAKGSQGPPAPVMAVGPSSSQDTQESQDLLIMFDELEEEEEGCKDPEGEEDASHKTQPVFFKSFVFSPDVPIRLDYQGKRVDMEQGTFTGILVGLAHLNCSELRLKRIHHRHGLLGLDRLIVFALNEWLQDIKKNQLPSILGGVGPLHSLVQLVHGIRDLFWLPVEQYKKDGRIVRGLQRGANSFVTCTAMSALELTNRVVQTVQYAAEVTYDMVSPGPSVRTKKKQKHKREQKFNQPADLREGVTNAYAIVTEGFKGTASNIYHVAMDEHELKGMTGAVGGVLRQIPPSVIAPVIIATDATSNILGGMRNQLLPDRKKEDEEKWKPDDD